MEIALEQHYTNCTPQLSHTPRETNTWADALTHEDFTGFNPDNRFIPDESENTWHILHRLLHEHQPVNEAD